MANCVWCEREVKRVSVTNLCNICLDGLSVSSSKHDEIQKKTRARIWFWVALTIAVALTN
jgi:hypothetical protein